VVKQDPVVNSKLASLFDMNSTSFDVDLLEGMVDLVVDCCHSVQPLFGGGGGEFTVVVEVNGARVLAILATVGGVLMGGMGCRIIGKLGEYQPSFPLFLPIMAEDPKVLFECLDGSLTESISLWVVGSR